MSRFIFVAAAIAVLVSLGVHSPSARGEIINYTASDLGNWNENWLFPTNGEDELACGRCSVSLFQEDGKAPDRSEFADEISKSSGEPTGLMAADFAQELQSNADPFVAQSEQVQTYQNEFDRFDADWQTEMAFTKDGNEPGIADVDRADLSLIAAFAVDGIL